MGFMTNIGNNELENVSIDIIGGYVGVNKLVKILDLRINRYWYRLDPYQSTPTILQFY